MLSEVSNSSNVTLVPADGKQPQCKFHKFGHCKFGTKCRNFHNPHTCPNSLNCKDSTCTARHPVSCRYHVKYGFCKFGADCSFLHSSTIEQNSDVKIDVKMLKESLEHLLNSIKIKEMEIERLEERIQLIDKHQSYCSCDKCGLLFSSVAFLKSHIESTHESNTHILKVHPPYFCEVCEKCFKTKATLKHT